MNPGRQTIIRRARDDDAAAIDQVALAAFAQYRDAYSDWAVFSRGVGAMSAIEAELIVAERDGGVCAAVGYVGPGLPKPAFFEPDWPAIRMLVVDPEARGQGLGRRLAEACIERARADAAPLIALHTSPIQQVALAMYQRMGFREHRPIAPIFGVPYAVYLLHLKDGRSSSHQPAGRQGRVAV
ncbi:MAG TPA: GNAT family N-acetyltransferase [Caulobacteraceae bacterium]|nr:GNAT family N-acetyltransferase [Caulobacteraceae bacterium]